jgi:hypothetical protein
MGRTLCSPSGQTLRSRTASVASNVFTQHRIPGVATDVRRLGLCQRSYGGARGSDNSSPLPHCALALSNSRCVTAMGTRHHQI